LEGTETHALHADGDADSAVTALFAEARLLAPRLVVVRALERAPKQLGIVSAVVGERRGITEPHADRVRQRIGRNEGLEANRRGIEAEGLRHAIHHPFHHEHALRPSRTAY